MVPSWPNNKVWIRLISHLNSHTCPGEQADQGRSACLDQAFPFGEVVKPACKFFHIFKVRILLLFQGSVAAGEHQPEGMLFLDGQAQYHLRFDSPDQFFPSS